MHIMKGDAGDKNNCPAKGSKKSHSPPQSKSCLCPISGEVALIAFHFTIRSMAPPVSSPGRGGASHRANTIFMTSVPGKAT